MKKTENKSEKNINPAPQNPSPEGDQGEDDFLDFEKTWTKEELGKEIDALESHPLFAKDPKNMDINSKEYQALQTLIYDEDDETLQENFYIQANNILKKYILIKNPKEDEQVYYLRQALFKYNEAIERKTENSELKAKIYCNRALVNLRLRNFGRVIEDCKNAILLDKNYLKAYFRQASAEFELKKFLNCLETCKIGIRIKKEKSLITLRNKTQKKIAIIEEKKEKKKIIKKMNLEATLKHLSSHKILYSPKTTLTLPPIYENIFQIKNQKIKTSIIFIYPEFSQFDFVKKSSEEDFVHNHFFFIFGKGLPWDSENIYNKDNCELFVEVNAQKALNGEVLGKKGVRKVGKEMSVLECLRIEGFVVPKILEVVVLCRDSMFYKHFLGKYQ